MAKKSAAVKQKAPSSLTMRLFDPGMSALHRAGLGGLACTLRYIERAYDLGILLDDELPGGPWMNRKPPWSVDRLQVVLDFGDPENAGEYLCRLFAIAFQVKDGLIYLPSQYFLEPPISVRNELQTGLTLSFLQHGRVRDLDKKETTECLHIEEQPIHISYKKCKSYKHQEGWKDLVDNKGCLKSCPIEVIGPINPGAVVRHVAYTGKTKIEEPASHVLSLYFSIVGCLTIPINRGSGVLLIPEVDDLIKFAANRPYMTPSSSRDCRITSAGDAALQAQVRLKAKQLVDWSDLPACNAITFKPTPWASQQKSRVHALNVSLNKETQLHQFEIALSQLPPKIVSRIKNETIGKGKNKMTVKKTEYFWVDSLIRPVIADNFARNRPFYQGFTDLMSKIDPVSKKPFHERVHFEKKGLKAMTDQTMEGSPEYIIVKAIHRAILHTLGRIKEDTQGNDKKPPTQATKNRWKNQYERWRLAFTGAKTPEQTRSALCDMFARAGIIDELKKDWPQILPKICKQTEWQLMRDLALLALASYSGKESEDALMEESEKNVA
ncbi:MAG: type I-MYXAN CRISPR-associated Cas8a1/Cmx1 [Candidatus Omnitrophica bacterium]|nr:type I-MYXAN CRISPR-associated Cas8a1/Cmx1 [Candidatus Omnitrophota bacterium]